MPFKNNEPRRHHIAKMLRRVTRVDGLGGRVARQGPQRTRPQHRQPPGGGVAAHQVAQPAVWAAACADRQHRAESLRCRTWLADKRGRRARRSWRKQHLAVDAGSGQIVASELTGQDVDETSQVQPLLDQIDGSIEQVSGYGQRWLVETTIGRYKALLGERLRSRGLAAQKTEAAIGVAVLNRMLAAGRPNSVRCHGSPD
jgi:hypothetical protein